MSCVLGTHGSLAMRKALYYEGLMILAESRGHEFLANLYHRLALCYLIKELEDNTGEEA